MPKEISVFDLHPPVSGEHECAAYNEDHKPKVKKEKDLFLSRHENRIESFWRIPTFYEILSMPVKQEIFRKVNLPYSLDQEKS